MARRRPGPKGSTCCATSDTYIEMGQFTDTGAMTTSWHRICTKAAFTRRLQAANLPVPSTPKKAASEQDKLIAKLAAMLATAAPSAAAAPAKAGKGRAA